MKTRFSSIAFFGVLLSGICVAQVQTDCTSNGTATNGAGSTTINTTTNCTSTDTGAAARERQKENDEAMSNMGNALGVGMANMMQAHHNKKVLKKYCAQHPGEDWKWGDATGTCAGEMTPETARRVLIVKFGQDFHKIGVAGYADIAGDTLTVHSERASAIRFKMVLQEPVTQARIRVMKQAGITTYIYTNDAAFRQTYDLTSGQIVIGAAAASTAPSPEQNK